jgi:hypothetical protein
MRDIYVARFIWNWSWGFGPWVTSLSAMIYIRPFQYYFLDMSVLSISKMLNWAGEGDTDGDCSAFLYGFLKHCLHIDRFRLTQIIA